MITPRFAPFTWNHVCESVALLAVLVIAIDFVFLVLGWPRISYSDGAAVVVAVGAVLGRNCYSLSSLDVLSQLFCLGSSHFDYVQRSFQII